MKQIEKGNWFWNLRGYQNRHRVYAVIAKRGRPSLALLARSLCDLPPQNAVNKDFRTQLFLASLKIIIHSSFFSLLLYSHGGIIERKSAVRGADGEPYRIARIWRQ